jgi:hypothetical protein
MSWGMALPNLSPFTATCNSFLAPILGDFHFLDVHFQPNENSLLISPPCPVTVVSSFNIGQFDLVLFQSNTNLWTHRKAVKIWDLLVFQIAGCMFAVGVDHLSKRLTIVQA